LLIVARRLLIALAAGAACAAAHAQPTAADWSALGPNNGGMHIVERIRLQDADTLAVELAITAPEVLTDTWTTTRLHGNAIFEHAPPPEDGRVPIGR